MIIELQEVTDYLETQDYEVEGYFYYLKNIDIIVSSLRTEKTKLWLNKKVNAASGYRDLPTFYEEEGLKKVVETLSEYKEYTFKNFIMLILAVVSLIFLRIPGFSLLKKKDYKNLDKSLILLMLFFYST